ncbi:hypothetical protein [Pararhodobacter oceanensis]|uniref:hypothetical protein n=1 Tax=Pararhodobacter oceanensis TaxID=2172121 RepID=UPI003A92C294
MTPEAACAGAEPFQDILDGYFTLRESLCQMMARHGFQWAWLTLRHAPIMQIDGLPPEAPVPLHMRDGYAGFIDGMMLTVIRRGSSDLLLHGSGAWRWLDRPDTTGLPQDIRLGEPAYLTGFGLSARPIAPLRRISADEVLGEARDVMRDSAAFRPFTA